MTAVGNDIWTGSFTVDKLGAWRFTILGWVDHFETWESELRKRLAAQGDPAKAVDVADADATTVPSTSGGWTVSTVAGDQNIPLAFRTGAILHRESRRARRRGRCQTAAAGGAHPEREGRPQRCPSTTTR